MTSRSTIPADEVAAALVTLSQCIGMVYSTAFISGDTATHIPPARREEACWSKSWTAEQQVKFMVARKSRTLVFPAGYQLCLICPPDAECAQHEFTKIAVSLFAAKK